MNVCVAAGTLRHGLGGGNDCVCGPESEALC